MSLSSCPECGKDISSIAENCPKCGFPVALFRSSASSEDNPYKSVASNPYASALLLSLLSRNEDWEIRAAVASNPSAPYDLLWTLSEDDDEDVRASVAENGNVPIPILESLADDAALEVANAIAKNPGTPEYIQTVVEDKIASAMQDDDDSYDYDDDDWYDDPADHDNLPEGYYSSRSGDFYVNESGVRCDVMDTSDIGGMRMYYDENNSCWLEC